MHEVVDDIWKWASENNAYVVIPTNVGWKMNNENVMGAGLAKQAVRKFPDIPRWYGEICKACKMHTPVVVHSKHKLILFPTKPLNQQAPHLSWQSSSSLDLIGHSSEQLVDMIQSGLIKSYVALPLVGCGNGGLPEAQVYPVLKNEFDLLESVTLIRQK